MYLTKDTITLTADSTGNDTEYSKVFNGFFVGYKYTPSTSLTLSTTAALTFNVESDTDNAILNRTIGATSGYTRFCGYPIYSRLSIQVGNTTDYPVASYPIVDERIRISIADCTAAALTGTLDIYVEGA